MKGIEISKTSFYTNHLDKRSEKCEYLHLMLSNWTIRKAYFRYFNAFVLKIVLFAELCFYVRCKICMEEEVNVDGRMM